MTPATTAGGRLRRLAARSAAAADPGAPPRCDLCAAALPENHRHLLDQRTGTLQCSCPACSLLMDHTAAGGTHYRLLPQQARELTGFVLPDTVWAGLGVPVGLAFFTRNADPPGITAGYPGALGLTRSAVTPDAWARVETLHPALPGLADDVEALLVHRERPDGGPDRHLIVPLDTCYRLAALVRAEWKGLTGGPDVQRSVSAFLTALTPTAGPEPTPGPVTRGTADRQEASWASP